MRTLVSRVVRAHKIVHLAVPGVLQGISFLTIPPIEKSGSIALLYKTVADQSACTLWQEKGNTPEKQVFLSNKARIPKQLGMRAGGDGGTEPLSGGHHEDSRSALLGMSALMKFPS